MKIALDYDGTITEDEIAWIKVCRTLADAGHEVYIVTMRYPSELADMWQGWAFTAKGIIATSRQAKRPFCEALGHYFNVWIDDSPRAVNEDAETIWGFSSPEGNVVTVNSQEV